MPKSNKNGSDFPNLRLKYKDMVVPAMMKQFNYTNVMEVPLINHISINMGIGDAKENPKKLESGIAELTLISGQKPVVTRAKKAISNFKLRENDPVGVNVTLRREKMYEFLDRFISIASPRIRDFRGLPNHGFDGRGNYNFGITEQIIFPEVDYDKVNQIRGLNITIVTTAKADEHALELLLAMGMPIRKKAVQTEEEVAV